MGEVLKEAFDKLRAGLAAIEEREGQWMHEGNERYIRLSVAEMRALLSLEG